MAQDRIKLLFNGTTSGSYEESRLQNIHYSVVENTQSNVGFMPASKMFNKLEFFFVVKEYYL